MYAKWPGSDPPDAKPERLEPTPKEDHEVRPDVQWRPMVLGAPQNIKNPSFAESTKNTWFLYVICHGFSWGGVVQPRPVLGEETRARHAGQPQTAGNGMEANLVWVCNERPFKQVGCI